MGFPYTQHLIEKTQWTVSKLRELIGERNVCIWGAGFLGRGIFLSLKRVGFEVTAFFDKSVDLFGQNYYNVPILSADDMFNIRNDNSFFIIAINEDVLPAQWILRLFNDNGLVFRKDFLMLGEIEWLKAYVDISGVCNLRCIACPRGNIEYPMKKGGFMSAEQYRKILKKLISEIQFLPSVRLFVFGEPFLNPNLANIIKISNEMLVNTIISTNLNIDNNMEEVIKAGPDRVEVSCSGFGSSNYEVTHTGGKWDIFYSNLCHLVKYRDMYNPQIKILLHFHLNMLNVNELKPIQNMCDEMKIELYVMQHSVFSDIILHYINGDKLSPGVLKSIELMEPSLDYRLSKAAKFRNERCGVAKSFPIINWDGSVQACCRFVGGGLQKLILTYLSVSW